MGKVVIRLHTDKADVIADYSHRSGLSVSVLMDRMLLTFIEHNPDWLTELMNERREAVEESAV